ncbi:MAG: hypothetical protein P8X75_12295 [Limibacillus sp.]
MKNRLITTTAAFCLGVFTAGVVGLDLTSGAQAQGSGVQQNRGGSSAGGGSGGAGYQGGRSSIDAEIFRGRGERVIIIFEEDDGEDSDRPDWAGGNTDDNIHSRGGGGQPGSAGTGKGDFYGDLYYLVRDPETGLPILDGGELQVCLDPDCVETVTMVDGELPEGVEGAEVDFGRTNVMRAPVPVMDHALQEVIDKLLPAQDVSVDEAGRLIIDGATVDSPLENLALYIALLTGDDRLDVVASKLPGDTLDLAYSALAAAADQTGDIDLDFTFNVNLLYLLSGVTDDYYDYGSFDYSRSYPTDYSYYYLATDGVTVLSATLDINDYLDAVNGALPTDGGITLFSAAADDALEVIELVHTQIHDGLLPGTVTP